MKCIVAADEMGFKRLVLISPDSVPEPNAKACSPNRSPPNAPPPRSTANAPQFVRDRHAGSDAALPQPFMHDLVVHLEGAELAGVVSLLFSLLMPPLFKPASEALP